jgi:hypothetical protein
MFCSLNLEEAPQISGKNTEMEMDLNILPMPIVVAMPMVSSSPCLSHSTDMSTKLEQRILADTQKNNSTLILGTHQSA